MVTILKRSITCLIFNFHSSNNNQFIVGRKYTAQITQKHHTYMDAQNHKD